MRSPPSSRRERGARAAAVESRCATTASCPSGAQPRATRPRYHHRHASRTASRSRRAELASVGAGRMEVDGVSRPAIGKTWPLSQSHSTPARGRRPLGTLAARLHQILNGIATAIFLLAILRTFEMTARVAGLGPQRAETAGTAASRARAGRSGRRRRGAVPRRGGGGAADLGRGAARGASSARELGDGLGLRERLGPLRRAALRGGDHGHHLDAPGAGHRRAVVGRSVARLGGHSPLAWWLSILTLGPLLGSLITEPAAMIICALLLARESSPSSRAPASATPRSACSSSTSRWAARSPPSRRRRC